VQAEPRATAGSDAASPFTAEFTAPQMGALRSRARKSAENKIQTWKPGLHDLPRRAVDCMPYHRCVLYRICGKELARKLSMEFQ